MSGISVARVANRLQELCISSPYSDFGYGRALREAIAGQDHFMEVEVLKSLGDIHLEKGKLIKDPAEFDKAAALYAAALLRCTDPDMGETLEHRIGYMEKLSRQLLQGYTPHFRWLLQDYWGTADNNVLRVAGMCHRLERSVGKSWHSLEDTYTKTLVTAIENGDVFLEVEALKSLGDFYLEKGKKTSDVSQFSTAAAMYNKALTRCGDPETKPTLEYRALYLVECLLDKIRRAVRKLHTSLASLSKYKDHLKDGDFSLARTDLDSAEQHFAAALKTVHVRDSTAQQYQREVEPLCRMGDVYSKRGQQTGDGGDFVKAAALYNAAIARSEDGHLNGNLETTIKEIEKLFVHCILGSNFSMVQDKTEKHKKQLKKMRDQIKLEMETIDQQLDPYVHDEDDPRVKEIEAKRAQAVRHLFEKIAKQRTEFIRQLVEECIGLMGPPPCKYALIGLGSQATGLVTPYSDLEFAILVEEESEECLVYFRNLTHYLHLKVVNLGETILPALGIKSLNDFYSENPLDNWYYDSVTPRGFAFDGSMPKASKTPLGRQGTNKSPPSELICTPENMVSILKNDATLYLKEGYHLATILRNPCVLAGEKGLIEIYMSITVKILDADGGKMGLQLAQEILLENPKTYSDISAKIVNVKKEIYRFPVVAVDCLALSSGIIPTTVWETIEDMKNQQVISATKAHHLTVLTSISAELRLRTYIANGGQKENLSALASMETAQHRQGSSLQANDETQTSALKQIFYLPNEKQLFRYYYTAVPLRELMKGSEMKVVPNSSSDFYDTSPGVQGELYFEICKYRLAISNYTEALEKVDDWKKPYMLSNIAVACYKMGDYRKAIKYNEQSLQTHKNVFGQISAHPQIATLLQNLGDAWDGLSDQKKAISFLERALQMYRAIYGQSTAHRNIVNSLNSLGVTWYNLGDNRKAINYFEQAEQMFRSIHGPVHPEIANILSNLGLALLMLGEYSKATICLEQALQMRESIYGQTAAHPDIATSRNNIGLAWHCLGNHKKAFVYLEQALQMCRSIYGMGAAHPHIAQSLNNLGTVWNSLGDQRKAISYYEQSLQMYRSIYGHSTAHSSIALLLNSLGNISCDLNDHKSAIRYSEQALQMYQSIYGQDIDHPNIAQSLCSLGQTWFSFGDYRKALSYYDQALQMLRSIYGQDKAHPDIVTSLNGMGVIWHHLGDYRKAISYIEQALQMGRDVYGQNTAHRDIATSLNNLGGACERLGDYSKAIGCHEQALQMCRSIYGQGKENPSIATSLTGLGEAWRQIGNYRKAVSYHEQALQMQRNIHGQKTAHLGIASSLNNIGVALNDLRDSKKAISFLKEALQMYKTIHGENTAHPLIGNLFNSLGAAWCHLGNYRKSVSHHEQALLIFKRVYSQGAAHYYIVITLFNMGWAWSRIGDHKAALSLCQEALAMARQVYPQHKTHPLIKQIEDAIVAITATASTTVIATIV
uniref:Protein-PII uridylyltransferase N-terminal domain-containing protein n=1 Tax=Branchiostoma floridae TaxID=7739 RepID=C3Z028_BRAFL|eukprot:XP_002598075.1 hypothetical protein BRAFLDRAFT_85709 [Branchiostoma floridae]